MSSPSPDRIAQAVQATAVLSVLLWTKVFVTNIGLGGAKMYAGTRPAEDTYQKSAETATEEEKQNLDRAQRIVNNDLENIPYTMVLAWGSIYCIGSAAARSGGVDSAALAHIALFTVFTVSRYAHSIVYMRGLSSARSIAWLIGALCSFAIAINGAIASFR